MGRYKMKKSSILLSALLLFAASPALAAAVGQPAPDFTATDYNGKAVKLSDFRGKIVVLEWTSNECPIVKKHYDSGNMQKLQTQAVGEGVEWLSVDSSGASK